MKPRTLFLAGIVVLAAQARLLPHPPNFTPIAALALFAAAHFRSRFLALLTPLAAMLLGDLGLEAASRWGLLSGWMANGTGLHSGMWVVYLAIALVGCLGLSLRGRQSVPAVAGCTVGGALLFYLVTNFAWWVGYDLYPHTWTGLLESYVAGLPFLKWNLLGDVCYATLLFGGFALAQKRYPVLRAEPVPGLEGLPEQWWGMFSTCRKNGHIENMPHDYVRNEKSSASNVRLGL
jgi:hypothetical protein